MMNKKRTRTTGRIKYALFAPLTAALLLVSNIETVARTTERIAEKVSTTLTEEIKTTPTTDQDYPIFQVVEQMPEFPGGMGECMKWLQTNIKYPKEAKEKGEQGRVILQFIVEKDGSITDVKVVRSVSPALDAEAIRVASAMPKWKPGMQRGKVVKVKYTLPVMFSLEKKGAVTSASVGTIPVDSKGEVNTDETFQVVEQMPEFPGGMGECMKWLQANIKYPKEAKEKGEQGRVILQFIVERDGSVTDVKVVRSISLALDAEAIRVVSGMPKWKPGMQRGKEVRVKYTLPVMFSLEKKEPASSDNTIIVDKGGTTKVDGNHIFQVVEEMPEFPGGMGECMKWIGQNIKYPKEAHDKGVQGRVLITFIVEKDGSITEPKVARGVSPALDAEALRIVSIMPKWKPAKQRGQVVRVKYTIPVMFRLN